MRFLIDGGHACHGSCCGDDEQNSISSFMEINNKSHVIDILFLAIGCYHT